MARGRKPRVRITEEALDKARKKIKGTPKRGRWPKYEAIHEMDKNDYLDCFLHPEKVIAHPKYKNAVFAKTNHRGDNVYDPTFEVFLPDEYQTLGVVRFYCESFDPNGASPLIDTTCLLRCERISCPYYRKGFITETLRNKTFEQDVEDELETRRIRAKND
jgi:hypothetical protein